jgi:hypothetical protein
MTSTTRSQAVLVVIARGSKLRRAIQ